MMDISATCYGYIDNEEDLALIFQGIFDEQLRCVERRPYEAEKAKLAGSGNIFVFSEEKSGIKRWTDGFSWSPSRISGKFLVYREYNRLGPAQNSILHDICDYNIFERSNRQYFYTGLLKKTFSLKFCTDHTNSNSMETFHIVAYYTEKDILQGSLKRPSENPFFDKFQPSQKLSDALQKVAVGNGRSNPSKSNERGRSRVQRSVIHRSLSSSSSYNDFTRNNTNPSRNIPANVSFIDGRSQIQTAPNSSNIIVDQYQQQQQRQRQQQQQQQQQQQYALPIYKSIEQQNQLPFPYTPHSIGIYNAGSQSGLRRTLSQSMIFYNTYSPCLPQPVPAPGVAPPLIYSSSKFNAIPYQNGDPYYPRQGPEHMSSSAPIPSNMMPPIYSMLPHNYPQQQQQQQQLVMSSNVLQHPNPNTAPTTGTKKVEEICVLPALRMSVPPPVQYPDVLTPKKTHKDNNSFDNKYLRYSK
ncbi:hypothetical protein SUVZ_15G3330 [Saccharomyces uvarum]|uniref:YHR177Wp-like protein n=1 Tax=Saccharomyces uvarum TaxID=230603 RepID=A0ABN8WRU2_SACUV|nr:hypothetical protein SUVZ_15G3330 [Saccharomyces uvarum]